jgi:hypothetical protein
MSKENILDKSFNKAINGGVSGFTAMSGQVFGLMWMRTIMNYQYRNGGTFKSTFKLLYKEGGIPRFYRGIGFALMQAPLSRFGDTAMNIGIMEALKDTDLSIASKTFVGSTGAALWRICIMPIDTLKSSMQVNGKEGLNLIKKRMNTYGIKTLYQGSIASGSATLVGHFPWFFTYNYLQDKIRPIKKTYRGYDKDGNYHIHDTNYYHMQKILRSGCIGFCASSVSDITSNSLKVIKVNKQTQQSTDSYLKLARNIVNNDGMIGLFTRGLGTKLVTNGIQGMVFTILFDYLQNK